MSARYFQGNSVTGSVQESAARSFKEVVDALRFRTILPITREDFFALDDKKRNAAKQVPFFVPACFKQTPSKRIYAEAVHCNLIFLDIDPEKELRDGKWVETGRYPAAPFVKNPNSLYTALEGFNFAAHVTASSTPEKPRMRIVVDAERIPLEAYPSASMTIAKLLGLPSITKESKVSVQPMFLPVTFRDTPEDEDPVIAFNFEGRAFTQADIGDDILSTAPQGKNGTHSNGSNGHEHHIDALEFLRAPVPEISLATTKDALFSIDSDCSRADWLNHAAALKHQFSPHKADEAFALFDEWSKVGQKYGGIEETEAAWKSLRPSPIGRLPVTIRSLLHKAKEAGWNDSRVKENVFNILVRWMEEVPTVMELMEQGVRKIVAAPLISSMQEDILISKLCAQAKKRFAHSIGTTSVRKDLLRAKAELKAAEAEPEKKPPVPPWARDVCYIIGTEEFFRHRTGERIKKEAFNSAYGRHLLPSKKQLVATNIPITPATLSTPTVRPSDYALNHLMIPTAQDYAYDPAQPNDRFIVIGGSRLVNTYSATYPLEDQRRSAEAGELLQEHLSNLIAEPENRRRITDWMAYNVQFPGRKIRWAVLLQSTEGAGKTFLAEVMKCVLGAEHVKILDGGSIKSGWNEWSVGKQVIVLEEVKVSGTNKHEIMNSLKPLITNDDISVNERFRNNRQVQNISNYIIFSNHHDALALTPGDRRYFVLKSPLQSKQQVLALGEDYFAKLFAFIRDYPGAMRSYLLNWEISADFRPDGHAPRTKYVQDMVNDSANDLTATIRRLLLEGDLPLVQYDIVSAFTLRTALVNEEGLTKVTAQQIAQVLREEGLHQLGRHLIGEDRHYLWGRPGITEDEAARTALDRHKRQLKNLGMDLIY